MDQIDKAMWVHTLWDPLDEMHQSPLNSKKEGIRVAAYCRISKGNTNYRSLENQVSYYSNYIYNKPNGNLSECISIIKYPVEPSNTEMDSSECFVMPGKERSI